MRVVSIGFEIVDGEKEISNLPPWMILYAGVTSRRYGYWAQLEMSFGYVSGWGHGCYTRELWR